MKFAIGSDRSGYQLKEAVKAHLEAQGHLLEDLGLTDPEGFRGYFEVAPAVCRRVLDGQADRGLLFCGTGMGMAIAANKFKGIYAAVVESIYAARMAAVVNQANVLTMGGWITGPQHACVMVDHWLAAGFGEGFPAERQAFLQHALEQVGQIERQNFRA